MNIDIGPNLAGILGSLVAALVPVVVLWLKGSRDHAETTQKVDDLHAKVDALAPVVKDTSRALPNS